MKNKTRWLALIDIDELLVPRQYDNLTDVLKEFEDQVAIGINWRTMR